MPQSSALDEVTAEEALAQRQEHAARGPDWLLHHGRRTAYLALWLCNEMQAAVDRDALYVGALLHDIGKDQEPHNEIGAAMTSTLLSALRTPIELQAICELIRCHTRYGQADLSVAAKLVQDADILDHVGVIDVWLAFYWSGAYHETVADHIRFLHSEENARYRIPPGLSPRAVTAAEQERQKDRETRRPILATCFPVFLLRLIACREVITPSSSCIQCRES